VILPPDLSGLSHTEKDALILRLAALADALTKRVAELEARLGQPPKTPDNSSTPPSRAPKAAVTAAPIGPKRRRKGRKGAFRALHPAPDHIRDVRLSRCPCCSGDVRKALQTVREACDMIDLPPITPVVTRVNLHGGRFKAPAPQGMPPGSPFGAGLRALVFYLRFTQGIALPPWISWDRLSRLLLE
jgi:transposase